jgi:hypothetical protein
LLFSVSNCNSMFFNFKLQQHVAICRAQACVYNLMLAPSTPLAERTRLQEASRCLY